MKKEGKKDKERKKGKGREHRGGKQAVRDKVKETIRVDLCVADSKIHVLTLVPYPWVHGVFFLSHIPTEMEISWYLFTC